VAAISKQRVQSFFDRADHAATTAEQGRLLEDLVEYIFRRVPGIQMVERNQLNAFATEELDIAVFNNRHRLGFDFLPQVILIECKNWSNPAGSQEVAYFSMKLQNRGLDSGILVSAKGVTGDPASLTAAHFELAASLLKRQQILVIDRVDLEALESTEQLVDLLKRRVLELVVSGTFCGRPAQVN
jgi:hypothetical protein